MTCGVEVDEGGLEGAGVVPLAVGATPVLVPETVGDVSTGPPPFVSPHAAATSMSNGDPLQIRRGRREEAKRGGRETAKKRMIEVLAHGPFDGKPR